MHSTVHFSLGMLIATALRLPPLIRAWRAGAHLAPCFARWILLSYALGIYAVMPNLLRRAGVPDPVCEGWWMNLFLFHPLLNRLPFHGSIAGAMLVAALFIWQYLLLLAALRGKRRGRERPAP